MCQRGQPLLGRALSPFDQDLCDAAVEIAVPRGRQLADECVSHQRMGEREPRGVRQLLQQVRPQGVVERVQHRLLRLAGSRPHELRVELGAGDRGEREQPSCALREAAGTCGDDVEHCIRDSALPRVLGQLANEERVAVGSLTERADSGGVRTPARQCLDDRGDGRPVEPGQGHTDDRPVAPDVGERRRERVARAQLGVPGAPEQKQWEALGPGRQAAHQEQRGPIGPVQVVQDQHERPPRRGPLEQLGEGVEHPGAVSLRVGGGLARAARRELPEAVREHVGDRERRQRLREWLIRRRRIILAAAVQYERAALLNRVRELRQQPGLAYARLTGDQRDAALAAARACERLVQASARRLSPCESTIPSRSETLRQRQAGRGRRSRSELLTPQPRRLLARRRRGRKAQLAR